MFSFPYRLAPEPFFSAGHYVLHKVALYVRNRSATVSDQQIRDLADAIHNLPAALIEYGHDFDEEKMRKIYFKSYDERYAKTPDCFSLIRTLDAGIEQKLKRDSGA